MSVSLSNDGIEKAIDEYHDSTGIVVLEVALAIAVVGGVLRMKGTLLVSLGFL